MKKIIKKDFMVKMAQLMINTYDGEFGAEVPVVNNMCTVSINETQFNYGILDDYFVVAFQGSVSKEDWDDNFKFKLESFNEKMITPYDVKSNIKVHKGFLEQWMNVRDLLFKKFEESGKEKAIFLGHSLGAALSTLASLDFQYNYLRLQKNEILNFAFALPRVGNSDFVKSYNNRVPNTYRFNYLNDIVTRVPPVWLGYKHVSNTIELAPLKYEILTMFTNIIGFIFGNPFDHYPENYYRGIVNYKKEDF